MIFSIRICRNSSDRKVNNKLSKQNNGKYVKEKLGVKIKNEIKLNLITSEIIFLTIF